VGDARLHRRAVDGDAGAIDDASEAMLRRDRPDGHLDPGFVGDVAEDAVRDGQAEVAAGRIEGLALHVDEEHHMAALAEEPRRLEADAGCAARDSDGALPDIAQRALLTPGFCRRSRRAAPTPRGSSSS